MLTFHARLATVRICVGRARLVVVRLHETSVTGPAWLHIHDGFVTGIGLIVELQVLFGVKLRLAGDNQGTVWTRGQSPATRNSSRNSARNSARNRTSNSLNWSHHWCKSIGRLV